MKNIIYLFTVFGLFFALTLNIKSLTFPIDIFINNFSQGLVSDFGIKFFTFIALVGDTFGILIMSFLTIIFLFKKKLYLKISILIGTMILTVGSSTLVKFLIERVRPENRIFEYHGFSFPSGHSTMAILFFGLLLFLILEEIKSKFIKKILIIFSVILAILIMYSRIYLSMHWFTDIIGGIFLGSFWLLLGILTYKFFDKKLK